MRKGLLGSIAALAAGAGTAWGQAPMPVAPAGGPPAAIGLAGDIIPVQGPAPVIMPPVAVGPQGDPLGLGPTAGLGPPPGPMYPNPGPYAAPMFQPPPPGQDGGGSGYGSAPHVWFTGEYLLLFNSAQPIRFPLLTSSAPSAGGVLGQASTVELITGKDLDYGTLNGFRLAGGFFGDDDRRLGFEMSALYSEPGVYRARFFAQPANGNGTGTPLLARPFIDTTVGNTALVVVSPGIAGQLPNANGTTTGTARLRSNTAYWQLEPNGVWNVYRSAPGARWWMSFDVMVGYKHAELQEAFEFNTSSLLNSVTVTPIFTPTGPFGFPVQIGSQITPANVGVGGVTIVSPVTVNISDKVSTTNRFNGTNFALRGEVRYGMFTFTGVGKVAVGNMHQTLRVRGLTTYENSQTGQSGYSFGGLYANASNIGTFDNDEFAVIPELNMSLGVNLTRSVSMFLGYNAIYVSRVARPGSQLNQVIDSSTVPFSATYGSTTAVRARPQLFVQDDFWLHGLSAGFSFRY